MSKLISGFVGLFATIVLLLQFTNLSTVLFSQTNEANNLKNQAVVAWETADKHVEIAAPLVEKVFSADNISGVPATRVGFTDDAKKGRTECESGATEYRKGAGLLSQASTMRVNEHYKKYLELKSKQLALSADIRDNVGDQFIMMLNPAETDGARLKEKLDDMEKKRADLVRQRDEAGAEAEKIIAEHADMFTK